MSEQRIKRHPRVPGLPPPDASNDNGRDQPNIALRPTDVMAVFFAWEKLRLVFNFLLFGMMLCYFNPLESPFLAGRAVELAVAANLCFCAGPVVENYLCWLAFPRKPPKRVRWFMFVIGIVFSCAETTVICAEIVANPQGNWHLRDP